jgi:hypothetical protein
MVMAAVAVAVQPVERTSTFQEPEVTVFGMVTAVLNDPLLMGAVASTPVAVPGPTGVIRISTVPATPLPETVMVSPAAADGSLSTTPDGVYVAQSGLIVVVVVELVVVVDAVVVVVVVVPPVPVQPNAASAKPATSTGRIMRPRVETFITDPPRRKPGTCHRVPVAPHRH